MYWTLSLSLKCLFVLLWWTPSSERLSNCSILLETNSHVRALLQAIGSEYTIIIAGNDFGSEKVLQKYSIQL